MLKISVIDHGATGNGIDLDTASLQSAIDVCAGEGGGRVIIPSGAHCLSGSLVLKAKVNLHLEDGAVLQASSNYADYSPEHSIDRLTGGVVTETVLPRRAFIAGYQAHGASITGPGEIRGGGQGFIADRGNHIHSMRAPEGGRSQYLERPFTIFLIDSEGVQISDITLTDPAFWAIRLTGCHQSVLRNVTLHSDMKIPNADGIDIDRCRNVLIADCEIITADDCVSIKSCAGTAVYGDTSDITIRNCRMTSASGAVTIGTESVGLMSDITVEDCVITNSHRGLAVRAREGGLITRVVFRRSRVETLAYSPEWWGHGEALHVTAFRWNHPDLVGDGNIERGYYGKVSDITFEDLDVVTEAGVLCWAETPGLITGVTFRDIRLQMSHRSPWPHRIDLRPNDSLPVVDRPHNAFEVVNAEGVTLHQVAITWEPATRSHYGTVMEAANSEVTTHDLTEQVSAS